MAFEDFKRILEQALWIGADDTIGAKGCGDGALGRLAIGEARDTEKGGFFLDATRISYDHEGGSDEGEKVEVGGGRQKPEPRPGNRTSFPDFELVGRSCDALEISRGAGMDWENDREGAGGPGGVAGRGG